MGFWREILGLAPFPAPQKREAGVSVSLGVSGLDLSGVSPSVRVDGDRALGVTAYKRALDVLAGSVARLPFRYMRQKGEVYEEFETSPLHYLLAVQPQLRLGAFDWKYQLVWRAFHDGNAYVYPRMTDGEVTELVLLDRGTVSYDDYNGVYTVNDIRNGVYGQFWEKDIIHVKFNTKGNGLGTPLWQVGRRALSIMATADNETLNRFSSGGMVHGILTNDKSGIRGLGNYQDEQLSKLAEVTEQKFMTSNIVSLPTDVDFKQISQSSSDMQFLESRKFAVLDISRLTGVPPIYLFDMAGSNYKAPEQADTAFLTQTLDVVLRTIESEFNRKLVPRSMCCKRRFDFDRKRVFSMDLSSMANYEAKMIQNGVMTVNDVRRMENQPPIADGDRVYISTNLAEIGSEKLSGGKTNINQESEQ